MRGDPPLSDAHASGTIPAANAAARTADQLFLLYALHQPLLATCLPANIGQLP